jgi:hypothetical protein
MFDQAIAERVVTEITNGKTLAELGRDSAMPDRRTLQRWAAENPSFAAELARARAESAFAIEDSTAELEQQVLDGKLDSQSAYTVMRNRHWRAKVRNPRTHGDKLQLDGDLKMEVTVNDPTLKARATLLPAVVAVALPKPDDADPA